MLEEIEDAGLVSEDDEGIEMNDEEVASEEEVKETTNPAKVIKNNTYARNYVFDKENHLWCELTFNVMKKA